jgi:hypothetical protein
MKIILNVVPIVFMIALIPVIASDYTLLAVYVLIALASLVIAHEKYDWLAYALGLVVMTVSEYFFIQTGVETFHRVSLLGVMPVWLPALWAYAFVALKRSLSTLSH